MVWGAVLGVASAGLGLIGQDKANKANKKRYKQGLEEYEAGRKRLGDLFDQGEHELRSGMGQSIRDIEGGFDSALNEASGIGVEAAGTIARTQKQRVAEADRVLSRRGLYNSTAALGVRRQAAFDESVATGQLGEQVAGIRAGLHSRKGLAMGDARARTATLLGSHFINRSQAEMGLLQNKLNWIYQREDTAGTNWLGLLNEGLSQGAEVAGAFGSAFQKKPA